MITIEKIAARGGVKRVAGLWKRVFKPKMRWQRYGSIRAEGKTSYVLSPETESKMKALKKARAKETPDAALYVAILGFAEKR